MKARISQLHMTEAEWQKYSQLVPEAGELIVYDPDKNHDFSRIKVGDGVRALQELDFLLDSAIAAVLKNVRFEDSVDGGRITEYRNKIK
jgi:hypothetical protein